VSALGGLRRRTMSRVLGIDLPAAHRSEYDAIDWLAGQVKDLRAELAELSGREFAKAAMLRTQRDGTEAAIAGLASVRNTPEYAAAFSDPYPLVSVRIASYRKTEALIDVALASVKRQTYDNYEVVIVNDGPNERTRNAIRGLGDPRIRYEELQQRGEYPEHPRLRWMVAGSPNMNRAIERARGSWVAPLDDDDEFTDDHLEKLVALAQASKAELVYGVARQINEVNGGHVDVWSDPPQISQFGFAAAMYVRALHSALQYDTESWLVNEPGDWNLARRMLAAGVTHASMGEVLVLCHQVPYTHKAEDD
jgi:Glycosyl transferase family 2